MKSTEEFSAAYTEHYKSICDTVDAVVWEFDPDAGKFTFIRFMGELFLGHTSEDWLELSLWPDFLHPDDRAVILEQRAFAHSNNAKFDLEYRLDTTGNAFQSVREISTVSTNAEGKQTIKGILLNNGAEHTPERFMPGNGYQHRQLVNSLPYPFLIQQNDSIVFTNDAARQMFGISHASQSDRILSDIIFCDLQHAHARNNSILTYAMKSCTTTETVRSITGHQFEVEITSTLTTWEGQPAIQTVIRDQSWIRQVLNSLEAEQNRTKLVLDHIGDGVCVVNLNGSIRSMNPAALNIFQINNDNLSRYLIHDLIHNNLSLYLNNSLNEIDKCELCAKLQSGVHYQINTVYTYPDSLTVKHLECESNPITHDGVLVGAVVTIRDVTEAKESSEQINTLTRALDQSPVAIFLSDTDGKIEYANSRYYDLSRPSTLNDSSQYNYWLGPKYVKVGRHEQIWGAVSHGNTWEGELDGFKEDGSRYFARGVVSPLKDNNGVVRHYLGILQDISKERYALELQKASELKVKLAFDNIANPIIIVSQKGAIETANPATGSLFGYNLEKLLALNISDIIKNITISDIETLSQPNPNQLLTETGEPIGPEAIALTNKGTEVPILISVGKLPQPDWRLDDRRRGKRISYICTVQSLKDQKLAQLAVEKSQKMDALGQLTGGLAHDFNNLLGIIIGNLDLANEETQKEDVISRYLSTATRAALRGAELTQSLLEFSRVSPTNTETINANEVIEELLNILKPTLTSRIEIKCSYGKNLWSNLLNRSELISALMNLTLNAKDAMPYGGKLIFKTQNVHTTEPKVVSVGICPPGDYVHITVTDDGEGMKSSTLDHMFDPFFTTKPKHKGTGLGLSTVFGFMHRANGLIDVKSELGIGTSVTLILPRTSQSVNSETSTSLETQSEITNKPEILLVDDEVDLLEFCKYTLQKHGHKVYTARNGEAALEVLKKQPQIRLMVSDIVMPGKFDGIDLCKIIEESGINLKIILITGFTNKIELEKDLPKNCFGLLRKPFRAHQLTSIVDNSILQEKTATNSDM